MQKYKVPFIPYDKNLVSRARELRKEFTESEEIFWNNVLKNKKLLKFKFTRQKPIDKFIVDFYCSKLSIVIEIDGEIHNFQNKRDKERDDILIKKFGLKVLRYKNDEVVNNADKIVEDLLEKIHNTTHP